MSDEDLEQFAMDRMKDRLPKMPDESPGQWPMIGAMPPAQGVALWLYWAWLRANPPAPPTPQTPPAYALRGIGVGTIASLVIAQLQEWNEERLAELEWDGRATREPQNQFEENHELVFGFVEIFGAMFDQLPEQQPATRFKPKPKNGKDGKRYHIWAWSKAK